MASFGLFGSSAPQIRRLQPSANVFGPTIEDLRAQQMAQLQAADATMQTRARPRLGAFGQGPANPAPAPAETPSRQPSPSYIPAATAKPSTAQDDGGFFRNFGYRPDETGQNFGEWLFSSREDVARAKAEQAGLRAQEQARAAQGAQIDALRKAGVSEPQIIAFLNNPEKWSENYSSNLAAANVSGGDSRYVNGKFITAPKLGETGGYFYNQSPDGVDIQGQRPMSYEEEAAAQKATNPIIQNTGGAIVAVSPDASKTRVLYQDPVGGGAAGAATYRPATIEDKRAYGIPDDVPAKFNLKTNEVEVITGARTPSLYTPTEQKNFRGKAQALGTLKNLSDQYRSLVDQYGPGLFDGKMEGLDWKKTPEGQKLLAAHNNLMMFLKGPEMFNLGVLTGPDVERLQRTLPEPVGMGALGQTKETLGIGLDSIDQLVGYQLNNIPEEYRQVSSPGTATPSAPKNSISWLTKNLPNFEQAQQDDVSDLLDKWK